MTEGAQQLMSSATKKRKKKRRRKINPDEIAPEEQNLLPAVSNQDSALAIPMENQTETQLNKALSTFTNTIGLLTSIMAQRSG